MNGNNRQRVAKLGVLLMLTAPNAILALSVSSIIHATAAHADDPADCDAPGYYMPCGESAPAPGDPVYNEPLGDEPGADGTPEQQWMADQIAQGINPDTGQPYGA